MVTQALATRLTRLVWRSVGALACTTSLTAFAQVLRWASQGDLQTVDPYSQNEALTNAINGQVYEALVGRDKQLRIVPALATEWEQTGPLVWRMKLRANVKFHGGQDFSADDVVFSIERARHQASGIRVYAAALGEVRGLDASTVEFRLKKLNPIFLEQVALIPIMSKAWCEEHDATNPQDFKAKEVRFTMLNANGTGPFILASRQPDVRTTFKRSRDWWGTSEGNVQEVIYTPIKSDPTRTAALLSGELDFVLDPPPQDLERLRATRTVKILDGVENRVLFIGMDQGRDELLYSSVKGRNPFKDARVRAALYSAIDIETLRTSVMRGQALPTGVISPSPLGIFNDPDLERRLPYDLPKARALMAQAGYAEGFEVTLDCPNNRYVNDEKVCIALSAMWAQIGVRVKVNAQPRALYFAKTEKLDTSMYLLGWGSAITDAEVTLGPVLHSRGEDGVGYYNWGNYKNSTLDRLAEDSALEAEPAKREQLIKAAFREHSEQVHHIPLYRQVVPWAMRSNVDAVHRPDNRLEWKWITIR